MNAIPALAALAVALASPTAKAAPLSQDVITESGPVRGAPIGSAVLSFKGIPYAAPPVGPLRWRPPQTALPWDVPRDTMQFGSPCFASPLPGRPPSTTESEDCLTINVWAPTEMSYIPRPVMVWVHGGGFQFGSSAMRGTDGAKLAERGVIVVSFNYRLGVLGFLAHPDLDQEGPASGNYGLQDQIAALKWVRQNIAAFGGDARNVTVFGQSAGAHAIGLLMTSPEADGLFEKAILQSGAFWDSEHGSIATHDEALARGLSFQQQFGVANVSALRDLPADLLNDAGRWDFRLDPGTTAFAPSVDGYVLRQSPAAVFAGQGQARVPLLVGWNAREETPLFLARALPHATPTAFRSAAVDLVGIDRLEDFETAYPVEDARTAETLIGDLVISQQTWEAATLQQRTLPDSVFVYHFAFQSDLTPLPNHSAEIKYVFGDLTPALPGAGPAGARDEALSAQMMAYWVNFARRGDPNGPTLVPWPTYDGPGTAVLTIAPDETAATSDSGADRFQFIQSLRTSGRFPEHWRTLRP